MYVSVYTGLTTCLIQSEVSDNQLSAVTLYVYMYCPHTSCTSLYDTVTESICGPEITFSQHTLWTAAET